MVIFYEHVEEVNGNGDNFENLDWICWPRKDCLTIGSSYVLENLLKMCIFCISDM